MGRCRRVVVHRKWFSTDGMERKCTPPKDYTVPVRYPYGTRYGTRTVPVHEIILFSLISRGDRIITSEVTSLSYHVK